MLSKAGSIVLKVNDLKKSVTFYRDVLGMRVDYEIDNLVVFKTDEIMFGIQQVEKGEPVTRGTNINFEVEDCVDEFYRRLQKKGIRFKLSPTNMDWGGRLSVLVDPDGYEIGFYEILGPLCEACGMPIKNEKMRGGGIADNPYCVFCCDDKGELKSRIEVREGMVRHYINNRGKSRTESEKAVDELMKWLPAWKDC
jgi:lactoylglutathione lyase